MIKKNDVTVEELIKRLDETNRRLDTASLFLKKDCMGEYMSIYSHVKETKKYLESLKG